MRMHSEYVRTRRTLYLLGFACIVLGCIGFVIPFIPGILPLVFGISLLSVHVPWLHSVAARIRTKHPGAGRQLKQLESFFINFFNLSAHAHEYVRIPTRTGHTLSGLVEQVPHANGVAILLHSASGVLETPLQNTLAEFCKAQGLTVVRFDAQLGLSENGAAYTDFTTSSYRNDFEDVLLWARNCSWWRESIFLVGHSVGALVAALYAQDHPGEIDSLLLVAPTISGNTYVDAFIKTDPEALTRWKHERLRAVRHPLSGERFSLSYGFVEDLLQYDVLPHAHKLTMPITIIAGTHDVTSPSENCRMFARALGTHATYVEVPTMKHTPESHREIRVFSNALFSLIRK